MSIIAYDIVNGVFQLLGRPSQTDLPYEDVLEHTRDFCRGRLVDMKLSARGHSTQVGEWVAPSSREMTSSGFLGGLTQVIPQKVEWRYSGTEQTNKAEVVAYEQLQDMYDQTGRSYVAFYNNWENIAFSEDVTELSRREYRVIYEELGMTTVSRTSVLDIPDLFITLGKYEVSLACLDQIRNETFSEERERLRGTFTAQFMMWNERFKKWERTQFGNKKVQKIGANARWRGNGGR